MSSLFLASERSSTCLTKASIFFCIASLAALSWSSDSSLSFSSFSRALRPSRRMLRSATLPSSVSLPTCLVSSLRRSYGPAAGA